MSYHKSQPWKNCSLHKSYAIKEEEDGSNVPLIIEPLDLNTFDPNDYFPSDNSEPNCLNDLYFNENETYQPNSETESNDLVIPNIQQNANFALQNPIQQPLHRHPMKPKQPKPVTKHRPKQTSFGKDFIKEWSCNLPHAKMNKYMITYIFEMIHQIFLGLQIENKPFERKARRSIDYCYNRYQNKAPLVLLVLNLFKEFAVINYVEDYQKSKEIEENDVERRNAGVIYRGQKLCIPPHLIGKEDLGFDMRGSQALIKSYFDPKFEPVKDLIIQKLKGLKF